MLTKFEYDTKLKSFLRFLGRFCVNSFLGLGLSLFGFMIEALIRRGGKKPEVASKYFLIYLLPSVVGCFILFAFADQCCLRLNLYKTHIEGSFADTVDKDVVYE